MDTRSVLPERLAMSAIAPPRVARPTLVHRLARPLSIALARVDPRLFYLGLALALGAWVVASQFAGAANRRRESASYDWMITHRFRVPAPDPDIVLVDIDERSLAAMAADYGRWPWPRDVLATVLAELEKQGARAVVFDILFADPDLQNPVSERAFDDAIAASRVAYFPVLRLDPATDATSRAHAGDLAGLVVARPPATSPPAAGRGPTLAVALPYFASAIASRRLGTYNVDPDADGLVRRYRLYEDLGDDVAGVRVLSLPARLAIDAGWPMPDAPEKALRFNDAAMAYRRVPFSDLFADVLRRERIRPADEFRGRIVIVGASATGLFDLKATPVSRIHPGMDLLAIAIDDAKNARFVGELGRTADVAIALALLALMTWLSIRYSHEELRLAFVVAPGLLFAVSYLTLNLSSTFVDLAQPASIAFVYFSAAKIYSAQVRRRWSEGELFRPLLEPHVAHWVGCAAIALHPTRRVPGFETRYLNLLRTTAPHVRITSGLDAQSWLGSAFSGVLVATWVEPADDPNAVARAREEASRLVDGIRAVGRRERAARSTFRAATIPADLSSEPAGASSLVPARLDRLRALVGETVWAVTRGEAA